MPKSCSIHSSINTWSTSKGLIYRTLKFVPHHNSIQRRLLKGPTVFRRKQIVVPLTSPSVRKTSRTLSLFVTLDYTTSSLTSFMSKPILPRWVYRKLYRRDLSCLLQETVAVGKAINYVCKRCTVKSRPLILRKKSHSRRTICTVVKHTKWCVLIYDP